MRVQSAILSLGAVALLSARPVAAQQVVDQNQPIARSIFGVTYTDHAKRLQQLLPDRLENYAPVEQVVDLSFIREMTDERSATAPVYQAKFEEGPDGWRV